MADSNTARDRAIQYLTACIERRGQSQILMLMFTTFATLTGVLASIWLNAVGVDSMAIRYPLSVGIAYLLFLLELSFFVSHHRAKRKNFVEGTAPWHCTDLSGIPQPIPIGNGGSPATLTEKPSEAGSGFDFGGFDGDGIVVILLIIAAIVSTIAASLFAIYQAPVMLAEVLVDGVLFFGIARRMNRLSDQYWLSGAVRRTLGPILILAVCYSAIGIGLQTIAPKATTMAEAFRATHQR